MLQLKPTGKPHIKLIAGLGNPGETYKNTYHNVGFLALNRLKEEREDSSPWKKLENLFAYAKSKNIVWIKPLVFMNGSGIALARAKKYFSAKGKILTENILVIHDDSDLKIGTFKMQFNRGSAGHKGVESIISSLGTQKFWRVRIGVRGEKNKKRAFDFILKKISPVNQMKVENVFKKISRLLK